MPLTSHVYVQFCRPVARRQVAPPSVETSTPATVPLVSDAVPLIVTVVPDATDALAAGEVIVDTGGTTTAEGGAGGGARCRVPGRGPLAPRPLTRPCWTPGGA